MALFADAFDALSSLQQTLDSFRASSWLTTGPSGGGSYPPMNVFRKGDDFILIAEVPRIQKSDLTMVGSSSPNMKAWSQFTRNTTWATRSVRSSTMVC